MKAMRSSMWIGIPVLMVMTVMMIGAKMMMHKREATMGEKALNRINETLEEAKMALGKAISLVQNALERAKVKGVVSGDHHQC